MDTRQDDFSFPAKILTVRSPAFVEVVSEVSNAAPDPIRFSNRHDDDIARRLDNALQRHMRTTDSQKPDLPCVIIAGGMSKRFGRAKAEALLGEKTLTEHMIDRARTQTNGPIAVNAKHVPKAPEGVSIITDVLSGEIGPLAGLHAALSWAKDRGHSSVFTTPVDTPFFPENLVERLIQSGPCAVAKFNDRLHPLFGIWDVAHLSVLEDAVRSGVRSMHDWVGLCAANSVEFPDAPKHAFYNINTPAQLEEAERLLALFSGHDR